MSNLLDLLLSRSSLSNDGTVITDNRSGNSLGAPLAIESLSTDPGRKFVVNDTVVSTPAINIDGSNLGLSLERLDDSVFVADNGTIRALIIDNHVFIIVFGLDHFSVGVELGSVHSSKDLIVLIGAVLEHGDNRALVGIREVNRGVEEVLLQLELVLCHRHLSKVHHGNYNYSIFKYL